ncbi:threonine--tRNA ligase [Candidatus Parcubacteria bacterium]|jgi:threonyl-tRNA synthetase|nr:threonine--tRNA ligase [Candidatus Parcubacteria bacterium]MBT7228282.1 threonine--tRNA ligase [Candidatus Parcubacteria bacterium]
MSKEQKIDEIRHSLSHILAMAVLKKFPDAKLGIGPTIENGFYYDFLLPDKLSDSDLPAIEKEMKRMIKRNIAFEKKITSRDEALKKAKKDKQDFKVELINDLPKDEEISFYESDTFSDLCAGPHVKNSGAIKNDAFKITHLAGAYWRGDEKNQMLTRIYGVAFETKKELDEYLEMVEEAKKRDHRKLGKELDLFVFSDVVGKGLPLWTAKGSTIRRELETFIVDEEIKRDYQHVYTPDIAKIDLYKKSGHYPYYKDSMYAPIKIDKEEFMLRPMSCPHHYELYLSKPKSYRDLPMRIAELAKLYRYEQSGELNGLIRVRSFCLADAHIICADVKQAKQEVGGALDLIEYIAQTFGLEFGKNFTYRLSLGDRKDDKKYYKNDKAWDQAEDILRQTLKEMKRDFVEAPDEASFYGPKIDVQMKNVLGKEDTAFTVQYDFVMPERFNLVYTDKKGKEKKAIVIHRSSVGALERVIAFLIEHFAGAFPLWLSPIHVKIITVGEGHIEFSKKMAKEFQSEGIRVEIDHSDETVGNKIRKSSQEKMPYTLVIGDKEMNSDDLAVRVRGKKDLLNIDKQKFISKIKTDIKNRELELL